VLRLSAHQRAAGVGERIVCGTPLAKTKKKDQKKNRSGFAIPPIVHKPQEKQTRTTLPHFCSKANTLLSKQATP
jgi:hypothetical protein